MGYSKRAFIEAAFAEIGYASYVYDLQPEQLDLALRRMDAMMATWNALGIRVGYPIPASPGSSDLDEETGVPDAVNEAIVTNLAIRLAPSVGKAASEETKATARAAYLAVLNKTAVMPEMQLPSTMPSGAGNKGWRNDDAFVTPPEDPLLAGKDGPLEFI
jgi:hypothetical protein